MNNSKLIKLIPNRSETLAYLENWLSVSPLLTHFGITRLSSECGSIELVCEFKPPEGYDYDSFYGDGGEITRGWLTGEILNYLRTSHEAVVFVVDFASSPDDLDFRDTKHPPFLSINEGIYWPIIDARDAASIEEIRAWSPTFREIFIFTKLPTQFPRPMKSMRLDEATIDSLALETNRIITNVFRETSYLDWKRSDVAP